MLRSARPSRRVSACCCCGSTSAGVSRRSYTLPPPPLTAAASTTGEPSTLPPPPASLPGSSRRPRKAPNAAPDFGSRPSPYLVDGAAPVRSPLRVPPTTARPPDTRTGLLQAHQPNLLDVVDSPKEQAVSSALPPSSFQDLLSRTRARLADPELAQPDEHAAHSEVGRAFVGELRDADGNVVEGRRLSNLALRLGTIGIIKREMGAVEKISFLPEPESPSLVLPPRDRFNLTLASVPSLPPPTPLRSHPLTRQLLYLPPQPGYAFTLQLPTWTQSRSVGGPSLEEVIRLGTGHDGDDTGGVRLPSRKLTLSELVEKGRAKGDTLVLATSDQPQAIADEAEASENDLDASPTLPIVPKTTSPTSAPEGEAADDEMSEEAQEAAREAALRRSLTYTVVLTPLSGNAIRRAEETYPPSLTFAHPYVPITNANHFRTFETRLWRALQTFAGFGGGLNRARSAMARRLGVETVTGSVEDERRKLQEEEETGRWKLGPHPDRSLPPHLKTPRTSFLAPRTPPPPTRSAPPPSPAISSPRPPPAAATPSGAADERPLMSTDEPAPPATSLASQRNTNESTLDLLPASPSTELASPAEPASASDGNVAESNTLNHLYEERPSVRPYLSVPSLVAEDEAAASAAAAAATEGRKTDSEAPTSAEQSGKQAEADVEQTPASSPPTSWLSRLFGSGGKSS